MRQLVARMPRNVGCVIDLHCHVLPGIDDGPATVDESLALVRAAYQAGVRTIVATPHVSWRYRNDDATIETAFRVLTDRLATEDLDIEVLRGAEIAATCIAEIEPGELAKLTLGQSRSLLLEPPFVTVITGFDDIAFSLMREGYEVVIAHPERCPGFHRDTDMLRRLVTAGARTSITAGALSGRFGKTVRRLALEMFDEQLAHSVASDAHDLLGRPPGIASEIEQAGLGGMLGWLTEEVPAAILRGEAMPPRPAGRLAPDKPPGLFARLHRR